MSEYIPTEARICIDFCNAATKRARPDGSFMSMEDADAAFSRWLAAHDAAVLRAAATELDESIHHLNPANPSELAYINCTRIDARLLRDRADRAEVPVKQEGESRG